MAVIQIQCQDSTLSRDSGYELSAVFLDILPLHLKSRVKINVLLLDKDGNGNGNGIYIPHFLYVYIQMRFTFNHPTHES